MRMAEICGTHTGCKGTKRQILTTSWEAADAGFRVQRGLMGQRTCAPTDPGGASVIGGSD